MNAKLKRKWVKALLSGRYKQASGQLYKDRKYCCLGVLAAIQGCQWKEGDPIIGGENAGSKDEWLLRPKFAGGLPTKSQKVLAAMNDDGKNFKEIAGYIEAEL